MNQVLAFIFNLVGMILDYSADYFESDVFKQAAEFFEGIEF